MANPGPSSSSFNNSQQPLSNVQQIAVIPLAVTPASVAAATVAEQTFTLAGLIAGDVVSINKPAVSNAVGIANVRVSAANTLAVAYVNPTAGALTPAAETYQVLIMRPAPGLNTLTSMPIL